MTTPNPTKMDGTLKVCPFCQGSKLSLGAELIPVVSCLSCFASAPLVTWQLSTRVQIEQSSRVGEGRQHTGECRSRMAKLAGQCSCEHESENAKLLVDGNSWYSQTQLDEIALAQPPLAPFGDVREIERAGDAIHMEARRLAGAEDGSDDCPHDYDQSALNWVRNRRMQLAAAALQSSTSAHVPEGIPCGGCGATQNSQRCMGCLHDFGTPESAWVQKYAAPALQAGEE